VKHSPVYLDHRKVVAPATRLIMCPTDSNLGVVTEEERADGAVPNEKHIAFMLPAKDSLRFVHDAGLGIDRALLEKRQLTSRAGPPRRSTTCLLRYRLVWSVARGSS
jgi:hypothetical protein